ncbi:MAG: ankyrin repeat domain-containing protein [Prosthecobacter sp.]|nr:ankyrin repeat domain-containing protein [Prosthecobacter sp.]
MSKAEKEESTIGRKTCKMLFLLVLFFVVFEVSSWISPTVRNLRYPMFAAARDGDFEKVKFLSHFGMINQRACDLKNCGLTAAEIAARNGHDEIVKFLISQGASPIREGTQVKNNPTVR